MSRDPYAPPASEEEQFIEVARILGRALHRWHRLNRGKGVKLDWPPDRCPSAEAHANTEAMIVPSS